MQIVPVAGAESLAQVRALFEEYWESFGFTPCFQGFGDEVASLPGRYATPSGRLALALVDGQPAGCIALRALSASQGEVKRLYLRPGFRGRGLGRALLQWIIAEARAIGYGELVCDTMPTMTDALALYDRAGFVRTGPYSPDPSPGAVYLRLELNPALEVPSPGNPAAR